MEAANPQVQILEDIIMNNQNRNQNRNQNNNQNQNQNSKTQNER